MTSLVRKVLVGAVLATACRGGESMSTCASPRSAAVDGSTAPVANPVRPVARVLAGEHALRHAVWTGADHVLAHDRHSLWRIRADASADGAPELTPIREPVTDIAGARAADVGVALTGTGELHVIRAGRVVRTFDGPVPLASPELQLSDDGAIVMVTGFHRGVGLRGVAAAFSTLTGEELGKLDDRFATLDPRGDFVQGTRGTFALRGMRRVAESLPGVATWIDHRVVFLDETTLSVVDAKTAKTTRISTGCNRHGVTRTDVVDLTKRRVVLDCGSRIVFVGIDDASVLAVPLEKKHQWVDVPWKGAGEPPERFELLAPLLARDGESVLIRRDREAPGLIEVDPITRSARPVAVGAVPFIRSGSSSVVGNEYPLCRIGPRQENHHAWCHARPSPDDRAALLVGANGGVSIIDARTGIQRLAWGIPDEPELRVVERRTSNGGVDLVGTAPASDRPTRLLRVGPTTPPDSGESNDVRVPRYQRRAPCALDMSESRAIAGRELFFGVDGACLCDAARCTPLALGSDERVVDAAADRIVTMTLATRLPTQTRLLDVAGSVIAEAPMPGKCRNATLLDEGQTLALICEERDDAGAARRALFEMALPKLSSTRRAPLPDGPIPGTGRILGGGKRALVLEESAESTPTANIFERADGRVSARLYTWATSAVVRFEDGRVELFGAEADRAVVCVQENRVAAFATCRDALTVRDRFRLD